MIESEPPARQLGSPRLQGPYAARPGQLAGAHVGAVRKVPDPVGERGADAVPLCLTQSRRMQGEYLGVLTGVLNP